MNVKCGMNAIKYVQTTMDHIHAHVELTTHLKDKANVDTRPVRS